MKFTAFGILNMLQQPMHMYDVDGYMHMCQDPKGKEA